MSQHRLPRRAVAVTAAAALTGGALVLGVLSSASAAGCATFTDPTGDAGPTTPAGQVPVDPEPGLDLTDVQIATVGDKLVGTLTVDDLGVGPAFHEGDRFQFSFTVNAKVVSVFAIRHSTGPDSDPAFLSDVVVFQNGVTVDGTTTGDVVTSAFDTTKETITLSVPTSVLDTAVGGTTAGKAFSALGARAAAFDLVQSVTYDSAAAPATLTYTGGSACDGGGGPAPAPSVSGSPAPTPSGSPSGSPSPSPSGSPSPSPSGSAPAPTPSGSPGGGSVLADFARAGCADILDDAGDATPKVVAGQGPGNNTDVDVTQVNYKATATELQAHVRLASVGAGSGAPFFNGVRIDAGFTFGGKALGLSATAPGAGTGSVAGVASTDLPVTAVFNAAAKTVVLSTTRAAVAKVTGKPLTDGSVLTATKASTAARNALGTFEADTAQDADAAKQVHTVGDLRCFFPPAPIVEVEADPSAQFGDTTTVFVSLRDESEQPLAGKVVSAALGRGPKASATTDEDGFAEVLVKVTDKAGASQLVATYAGDAEVGPARVARAFTIAVEKTVLKAVGGKGAVTATLTDDDKRAVAGQVVTFTVGKTKKTVKTDAKGVAKLAVAKGTTVTVSYPGSAGSYAAAKAVTAKAT